MEDRSNAIVERRKELMVSQAGENFKVRTAHFVKPSIGLRSIDETEVASLPKQSLSSLPITFEPKKWPLEVKFCGWRYPQENWKAWVVKMASLHESTWKKAGMFEAIMNSTYKIERNSDLVFEIAEKWCHETKTFIFSWGEATISLEDVMILGGYSVLGSPVFTPIETEETEEKWNKLNSARQEINRGTSKKVSHYPWMRKFMHSDSEIEHEAFLALWLSRFVLPSSFDVVVKSVFPIAIHLARGTRIALAPAVLATIYRDLSRLKQNIVASTQLESNCDGENVARTTTILSPLALVQVWIWERFLHLQPKPNLIENGKPRLALWHGLKCKVQHLRSVIDLAKKRFVWRPYARKISNCDVPKFYGDKAMWVSTDSSLDDELLSFARCLRASELVGLDCIEQYLPHRVALQFGMDQDIPRCVSRSNESPEAAWCDYNKSVGGGNLYIPPRHFEGDVSARYSKWWKQSMLSLQETRKKMLEEQGKFTDFKITPMSTDGMNESGDSTSFKRIFRSLKQSTEDELGSTPKRLKKLAKYPEWKKGVHNVDFVARSSERKKRGNNASMAHEFPPKSSKGLALGSEGNNEDKHESASKSSLSEPLKEPALSFAIPPGFHPKSNTVEAEGLSLDSDDEDQLTVAEMLKSNHRLDTVDGRDVGDNLSVQCRSSSSSMADNELPRCVELITALGAEKVLAAEAASIVPKGAAAIKDAIESNAVWQAEKTVGNNGCTDKKDASVNDIEDHGNRSLNEISRLNLEARIGRLERLVAEIKAARMLSHK